MAKGRDTSNIVLRDEQGNGHSDPEYVADTFLDYFSSVAIDLDENIPSSNINPLDYVGNPIDFSYFAFPSTADEVKSLIMSLPNRKCNSDDVPILVYKLLVDRISIMISDIFNRSLQEGVFPDSLKLSYIKPLFKALDRFSFQNYRPITSLHLLSKLLEKLMNRRLNNYLDKHSLISGHQYGFRKGFSTSDASLRFTNEVVNALNDKKYLVAVYLDLSKAFDTVNHKILLSKMERLGIRGLALDWYRSYLKDRTVQVEVDKILSKKMVVNIGAPQGSVTAPTLFLIYINDMCNVSDALGMVQFADDTMLYMVGDNLTELSYRMSGELAKIDRRLVTNRLSLNLTKTSYMVFSHNNIPDDPKIYVRNVDIDRVHKTSFLGINIDDQLQFSNHVDSRKLSRSAGAIYRMSSIAPVWGNSSEGNINKISRVHNRIMRLLHRLRMKILLNCWIYEGFTNISPWSLSISMSIIKLIHILAIFCQS